MAAMEDEIAKQTFSPPLPNELAHMLSPKTLKSNVEAAGKLLELDDYPRIMDEPPFQAALVNVAAQSHNLQDQPNRHLIPAW